ncbi:MAG: DUF4157 domain-containing protein [Methylococcaceae bacterium]|nr:DUF4157 domain-containing protein [Methylococcaceae bacterium]
MPDAAVAHSLQLFNAPEHNKDKKLQAKPLATGITPLTRRKTVNHETPEDEKKHRQAKFLNAVGEQALLRQPEADENDKEIIHAKSAGLLAGSFEAGDPVETEIGLSKGRGSPLPETVRAFMEPRFGVDFGQVRVHAGNEAMRMNESVGAQAFTHGNDIYFGAGHSPSELQLTAHELTHVVQQNGAMPLQPSRLEPPPLLGAAASVQRVCAACASGTAPCAKCAEEENPIQRKLSNCLIDSGKLAGLRPISRAPKALRRYSWDDFTGDVSNLGQSAVQGVEAAGSAVVSGVEAAGNAVVAETEEIGQTVQAGAKAVVNKVEAAGSAIVGGAKGLLSEGEAAANAIVSGGEKILDAGEGAVDWLLTEAGKLALSGANAIAGKFGGSVTLGSSGLIIKIREIELFESHKEEIIPPIPRLYLPILAAGAELGHTRQLKPLSH